MGCDVHGPFLEQKSKYGWEFVCRFDFQRNYYLFTLMAGVRDYGKYGQETFDPKGMPEDISYRTSSEYILYVRDDPEQQACSESCSRSSADRWLKSGCSKEWSKGVDGRVSFITNPDYHSASWLGTNEVGLLVKRFVAGTKRMCKEEEFPYNADPTAKLLKALHRLMKTLETPENPCRIVFYFDN